jgi:DNA-binding IclR family transcriptional regulator
MGMTSKEVSDVSSLSRLLRVFDLFTEDNLHWTIEAIAQALDVSVPTSYRYVKVLLDARLLQRASNAQVTLGVRVMALDHIIRMADPVLNVGKPFMQELTAQTGFDCVMTGLYGEQIIDTHREYGQVPLALRYGRGRLRPLYLGGAPKAILSCYTPAQLRKLFDAHLSEIAQAKLPTDWPAHRQYFRAIRKAGYYFSNGELCKRATVRFGGQFPSSAVSSAWLLWMSKNWRNSSCVLRKTSRLEFLSPYFYERSTHETRQLFKQPRSQLRHRRWRRCARSHAHLGQ